LSPTGTGTTAPKARKKTCGGKLSGKQAHAFLSNLRAWARQHDFSATDISRNLDIAAHSVRKWLCGAWCPSQRATAKIAKTLGVPEHRLYGKTWDDIQPQFAARESRVLDKKKARALLSNLRAWAKQHGFNAADIARNLGVHPYTARWWLNGKPAPSRNLAAVIAKTLGVPEGRLYGKAWNDIQPQVARYGREAMPAKLSAKFLSNLRAWAKQNGFRSAGIAMNLDASPPSVCEWLAGTRLPSYRAVSKAAAALGVPGDRLCGKAWDDIRPHARRRTLYVHETHAVIRTVLVLTDRNKPLLSDVAAAAKVRRQWFAENANGTTTIRMTKAERICAALGQTLSSVLDGNTRPESIPNATMTIHDRKPGKAPRTAKGQRISKTVLLTRTQSRALAITLSRPGFPLDRVSAASGLAVGVLRHLAGDNSCAGEAKTAVAQALGPKAAEAILAGTVPDPETISIPDVQSAGGSTTEEEIRRCFRAKLREVRMTSRWTQKALAEALGQTYTWICHIEAGRRNLSMTEVAKILSLSGCDLSGFLSREDTTFLLKNDRNVASASQVALGRKNTDQLRDMLSRWMDEHRLSRSNAARAIGVPVTLIKRALRASGGVRRSGVRRGGVRKISRGLGIPEEQVFAGPWPEPRNPKETIPDDEKSQFLETLAGWAKKHRAAPYQVARFLSATYQEMCGWPHFHKGIQRNTIRELSRTMGIPAEQVLRGPWPDPQAKDRNEHDKRRTRFLETFSLWQAKHRIPIVPTAAFLGVSSLVVSLWLRRRVRPNPSTIRRVASHLGIPVEQACEGPWPDPPEQQYADDEQRTRFLETLSLWQAKHRIPIVPTAAFLGVSPMVTSLWLHRQVRPNPATIGRVASHLGIPVEQACEGPWPDYDHAAAKTQRYSPGGTLRDLAARRQRGRALSATMKKHGISVTALSLASGIDRVSIGTLFIGTHPDTDTAMEKVLSALGSGGSAILNGTIAEINPETVRSITAMDRTR